jgi:hypothetical protein
LLKVLQPHAEVEPIQDRRLSDAGIRENAPQSGAPVGEGCQHRVGASPNRVEAAADQHLDVGIRFGDSARRWCTSKGWSWRAW